MNNPESPIKPEEADIDTSRYKRFIFLTFAFVLVFFLLNLITVLATVGNYNSKSSSFCAAIESRVKQTNVITGNKVLLISGSGVRAGLSAKTFSEQLNVQAVNFGLQAALGPCIVLREVKRVLQKGDTTIMVFELAQYLNINWNKIKLDYTMECKPDWFLNQSIPNLLEAVMAVNIKRVYDVLHYYYVASPKLIKPFSNNIYGDRTQDAFPKLTTRVKQRIGLYQPLNIGIDVNSAPAISISKYIFC